MSPEVRPAAAAETAAAVGVLARAFHDHPVYRHVLPDDDARRRRLPGLMHTIRGLHLLTMTRPARS